MNNLNIHYKSLIEGLKLLSIPYTKQKTYFPDFVDLPFELSDTYHNSFILLPSLIENGFFEYQVIANLIRMENLLNNVINNPLFENVEEICFLENTEWNNIRTFAENILEQIGEEVIPPESNFI